MGAATVRVGVFSRWVARLDRVIPPNLLADLEALPRARVVVGIVTASLVADVITAVYCAQRADVPTLWICGISGALQFVTLKLMWWTRRVGPSAALLTLLWMGSVIGSSVTIDASATICSGWPIFTITLATYLLGARAGVASSLAFGAALEAIAMLQAHGTLVTRHSAAWDSSAGMTFAALVLMSLCALIGTLHQRAYRRVVAEVTQAHRQAERSEASLRTVLDSARDAIVSVDRELRLVQVNQTARAAMAANGGDAGVEGSTLLENAFSYLTAARRGHLHPAAGPCCRRRRAR